jgi:ketosteroid isomerase-like protein
MAAGIWLTCDEVSFIHPRGHERGWNEVRRNFYELTMGGMFSQRRLEVHDVTITVYDAMAIAEFYWDFQATLRSDGTPLETQGRETQVFWRADGRWQLVHVHYSGMPVTGEREGF